MSVDGCCIFGRLPEQEVIAREGSALLALNVRGGVVLPSRYLLISVQHVLWPHELGAEWWTDSTELLPAVPEFRGRRPSEWPAFWRTYTQGDGSGRMLPHYHEQIILRLPGTPSFGKGPAMVVDEFDTSQRGYPEVLDRLRSC